MKVTKLLVIIGWLVCMLVGCQASALESGDIVETACEMITVSDYPWGALYSHDEGVQGVDIQAAPDSGDLTFQLTAVDGSFYVEKQYLESVTIKAGEAVGWMWDQPGDDAAYYWTGDLTHVDIMICQNEAPVGYAVVEIQKDPDSHHFVAEVLKCVTFANPEGGYLNVSETEIHERISKVKEVRS